MRCPAAALARLACNPNTPNLSRVSRFASKLVWLVIGGRDDYALKLIQQFLTFLFRYSPCQSRRCQESSRPQESPQEGRQEGRRSQESPRKEGRCQEGRPRKEGCCQEARCQEDRQEDWKEVISLVTFNSSPVKTSSLNIQIDFPFWFCLFYPFLYSPSLSDVKPSSL
jgi:hypothetical protein